jgi:hypothetical protein
MDRYVARKDRVRLHRHMLTEMDRIIFDTGVYGCIILKGILEERGLEM